MKMKEIELRGGGGSESLTPPGIRQWSISDFSFFFFFFLKNKINFPSVNLETKGHEHTERQAANLMPVDPWVDAWEKSPLTCIGR